VRVTSRRRREVVAGARRGSNSQVKSRTRHVTRTGSLPAGVDSSLRRLGGQALAPPGHGRVRTDVIAPPPGDLFSETNKLSVANLLTYGTVHVLLAGDAEVREEEHRPSRRRTGALRPRLRRGCQAGGSRFPPRFPGCGELHRGPHSQVG